MMRAPGLGPYLQVPSLTGGAYLGFHMEFPCYNYLKGGREEERESHARNGSQTRTNWLLGRARRFKSSITDPVAMISCLGLNVSSPDLVFISCLLRYVNSFCFSNSEADDPPGQLGTGTVLVKIQAIRVNLKLHHDSELLNAVCRILSEFSRSEICHYR